MSVIHGVRVRGVGKRDFTWKVSHSLTGRELDRPAKAAGVTPLSAYFAADYAVTAELDRLETELLELKYNGTIKSREADRRMKVILARADEEGDWFPLPEGIRTATALLTKLGETHPAANDLRALLKTLQQAAKKGNEFRLYSNP